VSGVSETAFLVCFQRWLKGDAAPGEYSYLLTEKDFGRKWRT